MANTTSITSATSPSNDLGPEDCPLCFCKIGTAREDGTIETQVTMPCCGNLLGERCLDTHRRLTPRPSNTLCPLCREQLQPAVSTSMRHSDDEPTHFIARVINSNLPLPFTHGAFPNSENHTSQPFAWQHEARRQEALRQEERELAQHEDADLEGFFDVDDPHGAQMLGLHGSILGPPGGFRSFSRVANGNASLEEQSASHARIPHSALGPVDLYTSRSTLPQSQDGSILVSMSLGVSACLFNDTYDHLDDD